MASQAVAETVQIDEWAVVAVEAALIVLVSQRSCRSGKDPQI
jgi:hypothetical protein